MQKIYIFVIIIAIIFHSSQAELYSQIQNNPSGCDSALLNMKNNGIFKADFNTETRIFIANDQYLSIISENNNQFTCLQSEDSQTPLFKVTLHLTNSNKIITPYVTNKWFAIRTIDSDMFITTSQLESITDTSNFNNLKLINFSKIDGDTFLVSFSRGCISCGEKGLYLGLYIASTNQLNEPFRIFEHIDNPNNEYDSFYCFYIESDRYFCSVYYDVTNPKVYLFILPSPISTLDGAYLKNNVASLSKSFQIKHPYWYQIDNKNFILLGYHIFHLDFSEVTGVDLNANKIQTNNYDLPKQMDLTGFSFTVVNTELVLFTWGGHFYFIYFKSKVSFIHTFGNKNYNLLANPASNIQVIGEMPATTSLTLIFSFDWLQCANKTIMGINSTGLINIKELVLPNQNDNLLLWYIVSATPSVGIVFSGKPITGTSFSQIFPSSIVYSAFRNNIELIVNITQEDTVFNWQYLVSNRFTFPSQVTDEFDYPTSNWCEVSLILCHQSCDSCEERGTDDDTKCIKCADTFYLVESTETPGHCVNQAPEGFYLDSVNEMYRKCYSSCATCSSWGDIDDNKCDSCKPEFGELQGWNDQQCIVAYECDNKFYFDDNDTFHCLGLDEHCPKEFSFLIVKTNQCVNTCNSPNNTKECKNNTCFSTKDTCVSECPIGTEWVPNLTFCKDMVPGISQPTISNDIIYFNTTTSKNDFIESMDDVIIIAKEILHKMDSNTITVIQSKDFTYVFYPSSETDSLKSSNNNFPLIDISECWGILRKIYNIPDDEELFISQIADRVNHDNINPNTSRNCTCKAYATSELQYDIMTSDGTVLDKSLCNSVIVSLPINPDTPGLDLEKAWTYEQEGVNVFDINDPFFTDVCSVISVDGKDLTLETRVDNIYQKISFCDDHCTLVDINYETNFVDCDCPPVEENNDFSSLWKSNEVVSMISEWWESTNIKWALCFSIFRKYNFINKNYGFYISIAVIAIIVINIFLFWFSSWRYIYASVNKTLHCPIKNSNSKNNQYNYKNNNTCIYTNPSVTSCNNLNKIKSSHQVQLSSNHLSVSPENQHSLFWEQNPKTSKTSNPLNDNETSEISSSDAKNKVSAVDAVKELSMWEEVEFSNQAWNEMDYQEALIEDKRTFLRQFFHIYCDKQIIFSTIFNGSLFNPLTLRWIMFLFTMFSFLFFTALFFTEDYITQRYYSNQIGFMYTIKNELSKSVYASIIGIIIGKIVIWISDINIKFNKIMKESIIDTSERNMQINRWINDMKTNNTLLFCFILTFSWFYFYFIVIFCVWFPNNQINLIQSTAITIWFNMILSLCLSIVISSFKYMGLRKKLK